MKLNIIRTMCKSAKSVDLVGPPCPRSHLRPIRLAKSIGDTPLQEQYRKTRLDLHSWNQKFWAAHNASFVKERDAFIAEKATAENKTLNADEMSIFYKAFLDRNWKTHIYYNMQWYKRNMSLLKLSLKVTFENISTKFKL